jgi:hypothetical protein
MPICVLGVLTKAEIADACEWEGGRSTAGTVKLTGIHYNLIRYWTEA